MKIAIYQVGKTKEKPYLEIEEEFLKRLRPFADIEIITTKNSEDFNLKEDYVIIALDARGKQMPSDKFAKFIEKQRDHEGGKIAFLIGGPHGFTEGELKKAHHVLSLSEMTFTHQMVRLFLLEQLYRAFAILNNKTYHY